MDLPSWKHELQTDLVIIDALLLEMHKIKPADDAKLQHLKDQITHKLAAPINPGNKKILIFTAFADTANYLYEHIAGSFLQSHQLHTGKVTGGDSPKSTLKTNYDFQSLLTLFSPRSKEKAAALPNEPCEIDILIGTDCISEGQNQPVTNVCQLFNQATEDGRNMRVYSDLLGKAIRSMINVQEDKDLDSLFSGGRTTALVNTIALKTQELSEDILRCIDQAIPLPIFYQLNFANRIKIKATYKRPSDADAGKWVTESYFETDWLPIESSRAELPVVLDLAGLYEHLLRSLIPLPPRAGESLKTQVERLSLLRTKQNEYRKLETRLNNEKQFNRKVELNAQLRVLQAALEKLKSIA
jgi:hypothetical protein